MEKFIATLALVVFTIAVASYSKTGDDQIAGDNNSTQMQEPGGVIGDIRASSGGL